LNVNIKTRWLEKLLHAAGTELVEGSNIVDEKKAKRLSWFGRQKEKKSLKVGCFLFLLGNILLISFFFSIRMQKPVAEEHPNLLTGRRRYLPRARSRRGKVPRHHPRTMSPPTRTPPNPSTSRKVTRRKGRAKAARREAVLAKEVLRRLPSMSASRPTIPRLSVPLKLKKDPRLAP